MADGRAARSEVTRAKLLAAARAEFQKNGLAGARVDAIADLAGVNKRLIYVYFGSKSALFDKVIADNVAHVADSVPFTPDDLPDYAVRLFDFWTEDTTSLRLFSWRNVELNATPDFEDATYSGMVDQIDRAHVAMKSGLPSSHLLAIIFALVLAWVIPAGTFGAPDARELSDRRASIRTVTQRMLVGDPS